MTAESARKKLVRGEHRQVYPPKVVADDATDREGLELPCIETIDRTNAGKSGAQERVSDRTRLIGCGLGNVVRCQAYGPLPTCFVAVKSAWNMSPEV